MIDSTPAASGAVVDEGTTGTSQPVVEADAGRQAEETREEALPQAGRGAGSVALEGEQVLAGPEDRLDALADGGQVRAAAALVLARRARHDRAQLRHGSCKLTAGVTLVADEQLTTVAAAAREQLEADLTLIAHGMGQLERLGRTIGAQIACRRTPQKKREWAAQ